MHSSFLDHLHSVRVLRTHSCLLKPLEGGGKTMMFPIRFPGQKISTNELLWNDFVNTHEELKMQIRAQKTSQTLQEHLCVKHQKLVICHANCRITQQIEVKVYFLNGSRPH